MERLIGSHDIEHIRADVWNGTQLHYLECQSPYLSSAFGIKGFALEGSDRSSCVLAIPPKHMSFMCHGYPWNLDLDWVDEVVVSLHHALLRLAAVAVATAQVVACVIQDETWAIGEVEQDVQLHIAVAAKLGLPFRMVNQTAIISNSTVMAVYLTTPVQ
jgi:hypothetical protein